MSAEGTRRVRAVSLNGITGAVRATVRKYRLLYRLWKLRKHFRQMNDARLEQFWESIR